MTAISCLKRARALIAGGFVNNPFGHCALADGSVCDWSDEGVAKFSVPGALRATAANHDELQGAWDALEESATPAYVRMVATAPPKDGTPLDDPSWQQWNDVWTSGARDALGLERWLDQPQRSLAHVLKVFDTAVLRAVREAA